MPHPTYLRTDTLDDATSSFELALEFYEQAQHDERLWKWFVLALHSGVQGSFALALKGSDGLLVQKPRVAAQTIAAFEAQAVPPAPHMDNFLRLYGKLQISGNLQSSDALPLPQSQEHEAGIAALDELRDNFLHFNTKSWSISKDLMREKARICIDVARFLLLESRSIRIFEDAQLARATTAITELAERLKVDA